MSDTEVNGSQGSVAKYWAAIKEGRFELPICDTCQKAIFYPRDFCPRCGSDSVTWRVLNGRGSVYSFSVIYTHPIPEFKERCPFVVALVDLDVGGRMMTELVGCQPDNSLIGRRVSVDFERRSEDVTIPVFRLEDTYAPGE